MHSLSTELPETDQRVARYVRAFWVQRCRGGADIPRYVIDNFKLDDLFEFAPVSSRFNADFLRPIREKPGGATQANP